MNMLPNSFSQEFVPPADFGFAGVVLSLSTFHLVSHMRLFGLFVKLKSDKMISADKDESVRINSICAFDVYRYK